MRCDGAISAFRFFTCKKFHQDVRGVTDDMALHTHKMQMLKRSFSSYVALSPARDIIHKVLNALDVREEP